MSGGRIAIDVAAGLVFRDDRLLITRRPAESHLGGLWEFPGGKVEPGETFQQCLVRELMEEVAIEIDVHDLLESITHEYPDRAVRLKFYRCRWRQHEPKPILCQAVAWISDAELDRYEFPAADGRLLQKLRDNWAKWAAF